MNQNQGFIEMLLHEARIAATLSHPNVVQIFDVGQVEAFGTHTLLASRMEHIHGAEGHPRDRIRAMKKDQASSTCCSTRRARVEHTLVQIFIALGIYFIAMEHIHGEDILAYAHDKRDLDGRPLSIVHRDISPQNVLISHSGEVKIVDFGIAKSEHASRGKRRRAAQLKGKVPYMSPEQAAGKDIDPRSDIFAVGVVLFELTTGKRLFKGANEFETLKLILESEYPQPSETSGPDTRASSSAS